MKRPFSTIAVLLLVVAAVLHALRLWFGWTASLAGSEIPMVVSAGGLAVALALAIGLWFEARGQAADAERTPDALASTRGAPPTRATKQFTVKQGKRYRATIALGFFEQVASNETIAAMLRDAGFADVKVTGTGARRIAEALWPGADTSAEMPQQIVSAIEIEPAVVVAAPVSPAQPAAVEKPVPPTQGTT